MALSSAVDSSAVARVTGIKNIYEARRGANTPYLPQRVAVVAQGATSATYPLTKAQFSNADDVGATYGFGSPLHLAARQLFPANGDGIGTIPATFYPLEDDGSGVAAVFDVTPTGTATEQAVFYVTVNNIRSSAIVLAAGESVTDFISKAIPAVQAVFEQPVIASDGTTTLTLTAKWAGASTNGLVVEIEGPTDAGMTFATAVTTPGAVNPDVQDALDQVGDVWETMFLNGMDLADTTTLTTFSTFGEGRWLPLVHKPCVVFTGNTADTVANATVVSDARPSDRINAQLVSPNSNDLPLVVAARQLARIVVLANNNPPHDYGSQAATGLVPAADGDQWTYAERDEAVKKGSSTIEVKDGVVNISDVVTFYHPSGETLPPYRFVVDIVRLMNITFNITLIFESQEWDGAPLIPDNTPTTNPTAKKPKTARAALAAMTEGLANDAILADPETINANTLVEINSDNPKRLDICYPAILSGNTNIKSIDNKWSFNFGASSLTA